MNKQNEKSYKLKQKKRDIFIYNTEDNVHNFPHLSILFHITLIRWRNIKKFSLFLVQTQTQRALNINI